MVTDPNIILSGNQMAQPRLPDVNAMMQTRTAGMENIYKIEQARAEQAQAAQKEQEAEAVKALSPAIAAAFSDPSDAGLDAALALVPPQYQGAAKAQLDQIRALPDPNRRKDLIRAGLVQDEAGRTLLGQLEMTAAQRANFDIQRGQLEVSRANAAREAAAANQPKVSFRETDAEGNVRMYDAAGNEIGMLPKAGKPAAAVGEDGVKLGPGERLKEDGTVEAIPGSALYTKQKSTQSKDYSAATNALRELDKVNKVVKELKNTTGYQKAAGTGVIMSNLPNTPLSGFTGAYDFQTKYKNLKGSVATLGRAAASLQGKLGNMAVQEWKLVSDAIANLDLESMDADVLDAQLDIIANDIMALEAQVRDAYQKEWGGTQFYSPLGERGAAGGSEGASDDPLNIRQ